MNDMICIPHRFPLFAPHSSTPVSASSIPGDLDTPEVSAHRLPNDGFAPEDPTDLPVADEAVLWPVALPVDVVDVDAMDVADALDTAVAEEVVDAARSPSVIAPTAPTAPTLPFSGYVDENALFKDLIDKHASRLYRFILKHIGNASDAEELAQQTFVEAVQAYRTFRGDSQLSTWLYGIAMNLVRNYLSRAPHRRHHMTDDSILDDMPESDIAGRTVHDPEQRFAQTQLFAQMDAALAELPEHMRELLILVGVEALSYEEAAVMLTIPIGTVRSRLSRARKALSDKLAARGVIL